MYSFVVLLSVCCQEVVSRLSSTRCRRRPCYKRSPRRAVRAPRPSAAAAGRSPRPRQSWPEEAAAVRTRSCGEAVPTTWLLVPSFPERSAMHARVRPNYDAATSALRRICITITPDVRYVRNYRCLT